MKKKQIEDYTVSTNAVWPNYLQYLQISLVNNYQTTSTNEITQTNCINATPSWKRVFELDSNRREESQDDALDPKILDTSSSASISIIEKPSCNGRAPEHVKNL